jgi:hypothetical protein
MYVLTFLKMLLTNAQQKGPLVDNPTIASTLSAYVSYQ